MPELSTSRGGGQRAQRTGRNSVSLNETPAPTKTIRALPTQAATRRVETGLEGLKGSFSNFYKQAANTLDVVNQVEHAKNMQDIKVENEAQRTDGIRRALAGEDLTADMQGDRDYTDAYSETLGRQNGLGIAQTFISEVAPNIPLDQDIEEAAQQYLMDALKNGDQLGVGVERYDVNFLSAFNEATRSTRTNHRVAGTQAQLEQGVTAHDATIVSNFGGISAEDIPRLISERRDLMPLDPNAAPAGVMNALITAAGSRPADAVRVVQMMNSPMSGRDGRSFSDLYPAAAIEIEGTLVDAYLNGKSLEASMIYREALDMAAMADDPAQIAFILDTVMGDMHEEYGAGGGHDRTKGALLEAHDRLAESTITRNRYLGMVYEGDLADHKFLRDNQESIMDQIGLNPILNPRGAGDFVSRAGVLNSNTQNLMSRTLTDMTEPAQVAAAVNFYHAIEQRDGEEFAIGLMNPSARASYRYMRDRMVLQGIDPVELVDSYNRNRETIAEAEDVSWKRLTGANTVEAGAQQLRSHIASEMEDKFGAPVQLTAQAETALMNMARLEAVQRGNLGPSHWKDTVTDVLDGVEGLQVYPGEGFVGSVGRSQLVAGMTMIPTNPDQPGFGEFRNPQTGDVENTLDVFRDDMRALEGLFGASGDMADLDTDRIRVSGNSAWAPLGYWTLLHGDDPMMLIPGETITLGDRELMIPDDPHMAANLLDEFPWDQLPGMQQDEQGSFSRFMDGERRVNQNPHERLSLIPYPAENPIGYMLGYQPGFRWRLPTVEEREAEYQTFEERRPNQAEAVRRLDDATQLDRDMQEQRNSQ